MQKKGPLQQHECCDESVLFIAGDGSLSYPDANGNIKAFRAYFKVK